MSATSEEALRTCVEHIANLNCDIDSLKNGLPPGALKDRIAKAVGEIHAVAEEIDQANNFGLYLG